MNFKDYLALNNGIRITSPVEAVRVAATPWRRMFIGLK